MSTSFFLTASCRVKEAWERKRNVDLCELAAKEPSQFWKAFKSPRSNACPVELSVQFEAFKALMGAEPQLAAHLLHQVYLLLAG